MESGSSGKSHQPRTGFGTVRIEDTPLVHRGKVHQIFQAMGAHYGGLQVEIISVT